MRLIDIEAEVCADCVCRDRCDRQPYCWAKEMQTVDAVPVVRCKDCKWFADNNDGDWLGCWLFQTIQIIPEDAPKPDDFCSYGEPKMDGGDNNAVD